MESAHKIKQEEAEYKERKRLEAEKSQIDKEMQNLFKIAEAKAKESTLEEPLPSIIEISDEEMEKIKTQKRESILREFKRKLEKERLQLVKAHEEVDVQKDKLRATYDKKATAKQKELELERIKQMRELAKQDKDDVKKSKELIEKQVKEQTELRKKEIKAKVFIGLLYQPILHFVQLACILITISYAD